MTRHCTHKVRQDRTPRRDCNCGRHGFPHRGMTRIHDRRNNAKDTGTVFCNILVKIEPFFYRQARARRYRTGMRQTECFDTIPPPPAHNAATTVDKALHRAGSRRPPVPGQPHRAAPGHRPKMMHFNHPGGNCARHRLRLHPQMLNNLLTAGQGCQGLPATRSGT
jgi:hypothetical protein